MHTYILIDGDTVSGYLAEPMLACIYSKFGNDSMVRVFHNKSHRPSSNFELWNNVCNLAKNVLHFSDSTLLFIPVVSSSPAQSDVAMFISARSLFFCSGLDLSKPNSAKFIICSDNSQMLQVFQSLSQYPVETFLISDSSCLAFQRSAAYFLELNNFLQGFCTFNDSVIQFSRILLLRVLNTLTVSEVEVSRFIDHLNSAVHFLCSFDWYSLFRHLMMVVVNGRIVVKDCKQVLVASTKKSVSCAPKLKHLRRS
ncbi:hypothetical protein RCL1_003800 [Eukaryota sp. TZLM3-RCL]